MLRRLTNTAPIFLLTWSSCCRENLLCFMHYGLSGNTMKSKKNTSKFSENLSRCSCSTVAIFDWIVFVAWLTDERCLALFPAGTTVRDPHHCKSLTRHEQVWTCAEPEFMDPSSSLVWIMLKTCQSLRWQKFQSMFWAVNKAATLF